MRVVIADDEVLLREGLARLLGEVGVEVVAAVGDAPALLRQVELDRPDVAIVDIKMPPTHTEEGLVAALRIRELHPLTGVLVLSHYLESRYAMRLFERQPERVGYLLKDRVSDIAVLVDSLHRIAEGECVLDPTIVSRLLARRRAPTPVDQLTGREREVLALMGEGRSNQGISQVLQLSLKTVEAHISHIFVKLGLPDTAADHRRVLAVLAALRTG
ncbi:response regulator transcription factor [Kribbella sp. NPDC006257]|uniref:response regulator transcription factor n=1 Tax=Kribbella sp. NPDC006257 TaxID=3156738 RepID=UPI0033BEF790